MTEQTPEQINEQIDFALASLKAHATEANAEHGLRRRKLRRIKAQLGANGSTAAALIAPTDLWLLTNPLRGL